MLVVVTWTMAALNVLVLLAVLVTLKDNVFVELWNHVLTKLVVLMHNVVLPVTVAKRNAIAHGTILTAIQI